MDILKMIRSFKFALKGILHLFRKENNAKFHLLAAVLVFSFGFYFKIERWEWFAVTFSIFFVFSAEAFNTALEKMCDKVHPDFSEQIGKIKDLAAGAVLFAAISAVITAFLVFFDKFKVLF